VSIEGLLWHTVSCLRVSPCQGIARPRNLFQSREAGALGRTLSKTHFILESILSTAWKAASLLCARPFLSNRERLSASKHLIKKQLHFSSRFILFGMDAFCFHCAACLAVCGSDSGSQKPGSH